MFRIRRIGITGIPPFVQTTWMHLSPYLTLIRGDNGAGKTTILETLAMLGHSCIMPIEAEDNVFKRWEFLPHIDYFLTIGSCPFDSSPTYRNKDGNHKSLSARWLELFPAGTVNDESPVEIHFRIILNLEAEATLTGGVLSDLKEDLSKETLLETRWRCAAREDSSDEQEQPRANFLRDLLRFSRPKQVSFGEDKEPKYEPSARSKVILNSDAGHDLRLPPFISYINTDMYQWGIGLDIRESPKQLDKELPLLIDKRLNLISAGDGERGMVQFPEIQEFWNFIFNDKKAGQSESETETSEATTSLESVLIKSDGDAEVVVSESRVKLSKKIKANNEENEKVVTPRNFLSSGENQVLALGIVLYALRPSNSTFLLDEPDLHLSLPSACRLYKRLHEKCCQDDLQIVVVSHLPFYFRHWMHEGDFNERQDENKEIFRKIHHIKPNLEGQDQKILTLMFLRKIIIQDADEKSMLAPEPLYQERAAYEIARFQSSEIESIVEQSREDLPKVQEMFQIWGKSIKELIYRAGAALRNVFGIGENPPNES